MTTYELAAKQATGRTAEMSNALVSQKEQVELLIKKGELFAAKRLLDTLHPLWNHLDYGYKGRELYRAIRDAARATIAEEQDYLSKIRKNDRTRHSTEANVARLEALVLEC